MTTHFDTYRLARRSELMYALIEASVIAAPRPFGETLHAIIGARTLTSITDEELLEATRRYLTILRISNGGNTTCPTTNS